MHQVDRLFTHGGTEVELINLYGPTEATMDVTYFDCRPGMDSVPIGKPIDNARIYIVERRMACSLSGCRENYASQVWGWLGVI